MPWVRRAEAGCRTASGRGLEELGARRRNGGLGTIYRRRKELPAGSMGPRVPRGRGALTHPRTLQRMRRRSAVAGGDHRPSLCRGGQRQAGGMPRTRAHASEPVRDLAVDGLEPWSASCGSHGCAGTQRLCSCSPLLPCRSGVGRRRFTTEQRSGSPSAVRLGLKRNARYRVTRSARPCGDVLRTFCAFVLPTPERQAKAAEQEWPNKSGIGGVPASTGPSPRPSPRRGAGEKPRSRLP